MALFHDKERQELVEAVRLPDVGKLPTSQGWMDYHRGDWLVTDGDNAQMIYGAAEFTARFTPATAEAQQLVAEPLPESVPDDE